MTTDEVATRLRDERFAHEARIVGIRNFTTPSLEAVERRRSELWTVAFLAMVCMAIAVILLSINKEAADVVKQPAFRVAVLGVTVVLAAYVLEKERHLRKLTRLLMDERVLTAALSNRLKELAMLCEVGKAVNSVLDLDQVLGIILSSATELLEGSSGSVMLFDGDQLRVVSEQGNPSAFDAHVAMGDGISGQVALLREPMLINGRVESSRRIAVESAMSVPLLNRDELLGVLNVNGSRERVFTEYDLRALTLFADHAAVAIANARLYEAERVHVAELLELDRMKSEFIATVSHELRTPLTSIMGCTRTMQRKELPAEVTAEFLQMIERQGQRLLALIEDVLDVQRAGAVDEVGIVPLDVRLLLEEVQRVQAAAEREVRLGVVPHLVVLGDRPSLERVFTNLVDNAHTHGGGNVTIEVAAVLDGDMPSALVSVLDRGRGVDPDDAERIFERFKRGPGAFSPGMGLGLYMVRSLVEAQGGRVWVTPRDGGGAAFRVLLPCTAQEA
ncbi:MAG TPA: ATP-binding protein [Acidimicrobiales bacterium]|nr:ATP-binding protein [Acidimicrobiales bacterium]